MTNKRVFFSAIKPQHLGGIPVNRNSSLEVEYAAATTTLFLFWYLWPHRLGWMTMKYPQKLRPWEWIANKHNYVGSGIRPQHLETQALGLNAQHFHDIRPQCVGRIPVKYIQKLKPSYRIILITICVLWDPTPALGSPMKHLPKLIISNLLVSSTLVMILVNHHQHHQ